MLFSIRERKIYFIFSSFTFYFTLLRFNSMIRIMCQRMYIGKPIKLFNKSKKKLIITQAEHGNYSKKQEYTTFSTHFVSFECWYEFLFVIWSWFIILLRFYSSVNEMKYFKSRGNITFDDAKIHELNLTEIMWFRYFRWNKCFDCKFFTMSQWII